MQIISERKDDVQRFITGKEAPVTICNLFSKYETIAPVKGKRPSPRGELINMFLEKLNSDRVLSGFKPLTAGFISMRLAQSQVKTKEQLYAFYNDCKNSKIGFSKYFWFAITVK